MRHDSIQVATGLFHLEISVLELIYGTHLGKESDPCSLSMWVDQLFRTQSKIWDKSTRHVKDYHRSLDLFNTVLDDCIVACISNYLHPKCNDTRQLDATLHTASSEKLHECINILSTYLSDFNLASRLRDRPTSERDTANESLLLFIQQGLVFRNFHLAPVKEIQVE